MVQIANYCVFYPKVLSNYLKLLKFTSMQCQRQIMLNNLDLSELNLLQLLELKCPFDMTLFFSYKIASSLNVPGHLAYPVIKSWYVCI